MKDVMIGYWLYSSCAVDTSETNEALPRIMRSAIRNNRSWGVTGFMVYGNGRFLQVVEGPPCSLGKLMPRVVADRVHFNVKTLSIGQRSERVFPVWDMGVYTPGLGLSRDVFKRMLESPDPATVMDLLTLGEAVARGIRARSEAAEMEHAVEQAAHARETGRQVIRFPLHGGPLASAAAHVPELEMAMRRAVPAVGQGSLYQTVRPVSDDRTAFG
jgi:hypothetical protein